MPVAWEKEPTDDELATLQTRIAETAPTVDDNGGYTWQISCPHCDTQMAIPLPRAVLDSLSAPEVRAYCQCHEDHTGRPKEVTAGCGFDAMTRIEIGTPET